MTPSSARAAPFRSEHVLQIAVAQYLDHALPPDAWWTSIDSAGRGPIQGARMKRRGVKRGLPDILIIYQRAVLWIELKSRLGRMTAEQREFEDIARTARHGYAILRSVEEVQAELRDSGIPLRARLS